MFSGSKSVRQIFFCLDLSFFEVYIYYFSIIFSLLNTLLQKLISEIKIDNCKVLIEKKMFRNIKLSLKSLILCSTQLIKFVSCSEKKKKKSKIIEKSLLRVKKKKNEILSELFCNNLGQDTKTPCFAEVLTVTRCKKNQGVLPNWQSETFSLFCFLFGRTKEHKLHKKMKRGRRETEEYNEQIK